MTGDGQADRTNDVLYRMREDSALGDFAIPLKVPGGSDDLARSFEEVGRLLAGVKEVFTLTFRVTDDHDVRTWSLAAGAQGCKVTDHEESTPDLEIFVDAQTCKQLLSGRIVPLEAFGGTDARPWRRATGTSSRAPAARRSWDTCQGRIATWLRPGGWCRVSKSETTLLSPPSGLLWRGETTPPQNEGLASIVDPASLRCEHGRSGSSK
jgi:hypothetical protein